MPPLPVLDRIENMRDLGGMPGHRGLLVRRGRLFRSGSPHRMTETDREALERLDIRTMIDLRSEWEQSHSPYEWPAGRKVSAPVAHDDRVSVIFRRFEEGTLTSEELEDWWGLTRVYDAPFEHIDALRVVFDALAEADPGEAVLFHCTGGKDRTGLVAALVLEALGVARDAIREDFVRSNVDVEALMARSPDFAAFMEMARRSRLTPDAIFSLTGVRSEWLDTLLEGIEERCGSVTGYLAHEVGIGEAGIERLRLKYLT